MTTIPPRRPTAAERRRKAWDALPDLATPRERRLIDRWLCLTWRSRRLYQYKVIRREEGEPLRSLHVFLDAPAGPGQPEGAVGVMMINRAYLLREIRRLAAEEREYNRRKAEREQGAYI